MNGVRTVKGKLVRKAGEKEWRVQWETKKVDIASRRPSDQTRYRLL